MRKALFAFTMFAFAASTAQAQTVPVLLTLDQAVARVQSAGFDLRLARADALLARADANASQAALRPQVSVSANALDANEPQLGMPIARQVYAAASVTVPLFAPGSAATARGSRHTALAADKAVDATGNDAVFAVIIAYRRVQLDDAILQARLSAVADQERHLQRTEQRISAGKAARYLVFRDRAARAAAVQAEEDASSDRDQAVNDLEAMLDRKPEPMSVEPLTQLPSTESRDALLTRALQSRPNIVAAEERVAAAESGRAAARAAYSPTAAVTAQTYNGNSSPMLGKAGGQVQLTAALPIFDGGTRSAASDRARAQYERARAARDQIHAEVTRDVANAWREYEAATRNLSTATAAATDAQEQLRLAQVRENAGKAIDVEVLDALSIAATSRETVARSIARFDLAVAALHHAAGYASLESARKGETP